MPRMTTDRGLNYLRNAMEDKILVNGKNVVDIGCGHGKLVLDAKKEGAVLSFGVDVDKKGNKCVYGIGSKQELEQIRVVQVKNEWGLPIKSGCADVVACSFVLPYVRDKIAFFGEILRILAPGGYTYILTAERKVEYASISKNWLNVFFLTGRKYYEKFEKIKNRAEKKTLVCSGWKNEEGDAKEFGMLLDGALFFEADSFPSQINSIGVNAAAFGFVFEKMLKKCKKLEFKRSGCGIMIKKDASFSEEDAQKVAACIEKANKKYFLMNIDLKKQENLDAPDFGPVMPMALTVLDSKIME